MFASHHHEVARHTCNINYNTNEWKLFYDSLQIVFEIEQELTRVYFDEMNCGTRDDILEKMQSMMDMAERRMNDIYPTT